MAPRDDGDGMWRPVSRPRSHELVLAQVRDRIRAGLLGPGDRLPGERELADVLGVGRAAVREALRVLEALGVGEAATGSSAVAGTRVVPALGEAAARVVGVHAALGSFDAGEAREVLEALGDPGGNRLAAALVPALRAVLDADEHGVDTAGTREPRAG